MHYLLALGSGPAAVQLTEELRAALAAAGHHEGGPPVLLSHHLAEAARATDAEAVIVARTLGGDEPPGEAVVALRQALPRARVVVLLGTSDEEARELARQAAHGADRPTRRGGGVSLPVDPERSPVQEAGFAERCPALVQSLAATPTVERAGRCGAAV